MRQFMNQAAFGVYHCHNKSYVMVEYDGGFATVDKQDNGFCEKCEAKIMEYLKI